LMSINEACIVKTCVMLPENPQKSPWLTKILISDTKEYLAGLHITLVALFQKEASQTVPAASFLPRVAREDGPGPFEFNWETNPAPKIVNKDVPEEAETIPELNEDTKTLKAMTPDATDAETVVSTLVITLTLPPALAAPNVKPESVTVTAVLAASTAPAVVMTMEVVPGAEMGPREAPPDTAPVGVGLPAKKLLG